MGLDLKRKSTQKLLKFYDLRVQTYWLNEFDWPELDFNQELANYVTPNLSSLLGY